MRQRRLTHKEKTELFAKYETGKYSGADLAKQYNISSVAVNTSRNILKEGLKIISGGTLDNTDGDSNKTSVKKHKSVKSEAQPIGSAVGG